MINIFVLSTCSSHTHGACVSLQSHSPFAPSLQTFPARARVRVHPRVYVCMIYATQKVNSGMPDLKTKHSVKKVYSRHKLVTSFTGMGERSIFKSSRRPTIRNVRGIVMSARYLIPYRSCGAGILSTHLMLSRFLLVLKMSVPDTIR